MGAPAPLLLFPLAFCARPSLCVCMCPCVCGAAFLCPVACLLLFFVCLLDTIFRPQLANFNSISCLVPFLSVLTCLRGRMCSLAHDPHFYRRRCCALCPLSMPHTTAAELRAARGACGTRRKKWAVLDVCQRCAGTQAGLRMQTCTNRRSPTLAGGQRCGGTKGRVPQRRTKKNRARQRCSDGMAGEGGVRGAARTCLLPVAARTTSLSLSLSFSSPLVLLL